MNDIISNKISMYLSVKLWLENHIAQTSIIPIIAIVEAEFNQNVTDIFSVSIAVNEKITGYAKDKAAKKSNLIISILTISTAFTAWAMLTGNKEESIKFKKTPAGLKALRDADIFTYAQTLHTHTLPMLPTLAAYSVTALNFTQLEADNTAFGNEINAPKNAITQRNQAMQNLRELVNKQDILLKQKLDKLIQILGVSDKTILKSYQMCRSIIDR